MELFDMHMDRRIVLCNTVDKCVILRKRLFRNLLNGL